MKSILSLFIFCILFASVSAQVTDKGNFLIGGTLGFSANGSKVNVEANGVSEDLDGASAFQLNVSPSIGYFFANNFAAGIGLDYSYSRVEEAALEGQDSDTSLDSDLLFGPFARYYLPMGNDKAVFFEGSFGFGNSVNEFDTGSGTQTSATSVQVYGIGPGFTIFSRNAIGIEALVKYNFARSSSEVDFDGVNTKITSLTNQVDFSVGLQVYFSRIKPAADR